MATMEADPSVARDVVKLMEGHRLLCPSVHIGFGKHNAVNSRFGQRLMDFSPF